MIRIDSGAFRKWLIQARTKIPINNARAMDRIARLAATDAKRSARFTSRTYRLRRSIRAQLLTPYHSRTIADAKHAFWVENGNGPRGGRIYPKTAKALRFELNGVVHFRKWVHTALPRPFMRDARHAALPLFSRLVIEAATLSLK